MKNSLFFPSLEFELCNLYVAHFVGFANTFGLIIEKVMENITKGKRKRSSKTTRTQYMLYLETLESNEHFRTNKFSPENENILKETWEQLTRSLNSSGGPQRSSNEWRRIFSDWKSAVRKRARAIKVEETKTGGGPPEKPLNDLEQKLINVLGVIVIDGIPGVSELGLPTNESPVNNNIDTSSDKLPIKQTDNNVPSVSYNRTNPTASKNLTGSDCGSMFQKEFKKPVKKRSTFISSVENYLKNHVEINYSPILGEINENLKELVATEQQKLKLDCLRFQLQYPDVDIEKSLANE